MKPRYQEARRQANLLIKKNGYQEPPIIMSDVVASLGLSVYSIPLVAYMGSSYSDVAGFIDFSNKRIIVNDEDTIQRQNFTIAHEMGHYVLHQDPNQSNNESANVLYRSKMLNDENDPKEKEANYFAACLLVPLDMLRKYQQTPVDLLATFFGVSQAVITYRLKTLGI